MKLRYISAHFEIHLATLDIFYFPSTKVRYCNETKTNHLPTNGRSPLFSLR